MLGLEVNSISKRDPGKTLAVYKMRGVGDEKIERNSGINWERLCIFEGYLYILDSCSDRAFDKGARIEKW